MWLPDTLPFSSALSELAHATWAQRPPHVFNGSVLIHQQTRTVAGVLELQGVFADYQFYYAQKKTQTDFGLKPIAVSGLIVCEGHIIFGQRSSQVTSYAGWWELAPSGAIDREMAREDGSVDFIAQLRAEFSEEILLPADYIERITPFGVIFDPNDPVYDVICEIQLHSTCQDILTAMQQGDEYSAAVAVPIPELTTWLHEHQSDLIPPSQAIVKLWSQRP